MASRVRTSLVMAALRMAEFRTGITPKRGASGLILHSHKGSQYASAELRGHLQNHGYKQSMSSVANCFDSAPMESKSLPLNPVFSRG